MRPSLHRSRPRRTPRFHAPRVLFRAPRLRAEVLNLSTSGAAIETTDSPPRIGTEILCELESEHTLALVQGQVRWCKLGGTTDGASGDVIPVYRAGIHFPNGSPRNLLRILRSAGLQRPAGNS